jgi:hypothetical protein
VQAKHVGHMHATPTPSQELRSHGMQGQKGAICDASTLSRKTRVAQAHRLCVLPSILPLISTASAPAWPSVRSPQQSPDPHQLLSSTADAPVGNIQEFSGLEINRTQVPRSSCAALALTQSQCSLHGKATHHCSCISAKPQGRCQAVARIQRTHGRGARLAAKQAHLLVSPVARAAAAVPPPVAALLAPPVPITLAVPPLIPACAQCCCIQCSYRRDSSICSAAAPAKPSFL